VSDGKRVNQAAGLSSIMMNDGGYLAPVHMNTLDGFRVDIVNATTLLPVVDPTIAVGMQVHFTLDAESKVWVSFSKVVAIISSWGSEVLMYSKTGTGSALSMIQLIGENYSSVSMMRTANRYSIAVRVEALDVPPEDGFVPMNPSHGAAGWLEIVGLGDLDKAKYGVRITPLCGGVW
jgi:hypothetical protein